MTHEVKFDAEEFDSGEFALSFEKIPRKVSIGKRTMKHRLPQKKSSLAARNAHNLNILAATDANAEIRDTRVNIIQAGWERVLNGIRRPQDLEYLYYMEKQFLDEVNIAYLKALKEIQGKRA